MTSTGLVRGRVGATLDQAPAPTLIYATGGLAVVGIEHTISDTETTFDGGLFGPNTTTVDGICVVCFGGSSPGDPFPFDFDTQLHTIRANLTWKIGG